MLFNTNYSTQHYSFIGTQSNGSKYCYLEPINQFRHTVIEFQMYLFNTNNSVQHYSFIYSQFNGSKYYNVLLTIPVDINHLFIHN